MTENLPAVVETRALAPVATTDTDSWVEVMRPVIALADRICDTEFVPRGLRGSAPATAAAMLYGREIGLPPMTALGSTHVIEGKPGISAEIMRALIFAAGHEIEFGDCTSARASLRGRRRGQETWTVVEWTIDMARAAGLLGKNNWKSYPADQLVARATTTLARRLFPDVIHGFSSVEELADLDDDGTPVEGPVAGPATRVGRKKAPAKKAAAALPAPREARPEPSSGPPLPGEDGYENGAEPAPQEPPAETTDAPAETTDAPVPAGTTDESPDGDGEGEAPEPSGDSEAPSSGGKRGPRKASRAQHRMIFALLDPLEVTSDEDRYDVVSAIVGRRVESFNDLTVDNASAVVDTLGRVNDRDALDQLLAAAAKGDES